MRRELPIAIILIAAGIALWAGKNGELNRIVSLFQRRPPAASKSIDLPSLSQPKFLSASSPSSPFNGPSDRQTDGQTDSQTNNPDGNNFALQPSSLQAGLSASTLEANELLGKISAALRDSPAFKLDLLAELIWQESSLLVSGQYAQRGQGTEQSRIDLQIGTGADARTLSKICDGRFLYSLQRSQSQKKLQFIDLRKIQETRFSSGLSQPDHPSSWIATGGLVGCFENLAAAFQFSPPQLYQANGLPLIQLDGIWHPAALRELLTSSVPHYHLDPEILWQKLPQHVPHQIRITFAQHEGLGWLPQQITFYQFAESAKAPLSAAAPNAGLRLLAKLRFSSPQLIDVDEAGFLQLNTEDLETIDNTPLYISQVKQFELLRQAQSPSDPSTILR